MSNKTNRKRAKNKDDPNFDHLNMNRMTKKARLNNENTKLQNQQPAIIRDGYLSLNQATYEQSTAFSATSTTSSNGSAGSVVSIDQNPPDSEIEKIDFPCRAIDQHDSVIRKSKAIPYRALFKQPGTAEFDLRKDDLIGKQYKVIKLMGKGTFSKVYSCRDTLANKEIALKIFTQRNQVSLVKIETQIAFHLKNADPTDNFNFVKILDLFRCRNQFFIVYENLSLSLYDYMVNVRKAGYTIKELRVISKQTVATLEFLHRQRICHTDLKPENILLVDPIVKGQPASLRIKIIDFGSSVMCFSETAQNNGTVTTRHYRAPEVLMKLNWSFPIDVFSVGVTIFELYTQILLFPAVISNLEHIVIMSCTLGKLPSMYRRRKPHYFKHIDALDEQEVAKHKPFEKYFDFANADVSQLYKFLRRMLAYDPVKRATMKDLLTDPFIKNAEC